MDGVKELRAEDDVSLSRDADISDSYISQRNTASSTIRCVRFIDLNGKNHHWHPVSVLSYRLKDGRSKVEEEMQARQRFCYFKNTLISLIKQKIKCIAVYSRMMTFILMSYEYNCIRNCSF